MRKRLDPIQKQFLLLIPLILIIMQAISNNKYLCTDFLQSRLLSDQKLQCDNDNIKTAYGNNDVTPIT